MGRLRLAVAGLIVALTSTSVFAGSVLQPGATAGLPVGKPFDEGIYFIETSSFGHRGNIPGVGNVNLPLIVWSTPWTFYDTRLQFFFLQPFVTTIGRQPSDVAFANSTLFAAQLAHDFGNGFGGSYLAGYRAPMASDFAFRSPSFEQRGALSYTANGWNATVNVINGLFGDRGGYPDWLNVDLTLTKKFDKLEIGAVAFGSTDLNRPFVGYRRQGQIAVGGLVGYNFGKFTLQFYGTTDVSTRGYTGKDTRGWVRLILPLYKASKAPEPIRARF